MRVFGFDEMRFYGFGLRMGLNNLIRNGLALSLRKTIGKISQPINSYKRFPEYYYMDQAIQRYLTERQISQPVQILDVGSPKCFGLYLASTLATEIELTDLSRLNLDEYQIMWKRLNSRAKGHAHFSSQDARSLEYEKATFDIVYSMSVIEHIEGVGGDSQGVREMVRVLRPGGLILISLPFAVAYEEQYRYGFASAVHKTDDGNCYFFQRIYDRPSLESRILDSMTQVQVRSIWTVWRKNAYLARRYGRLGVNIRGMLGIANPWISAWLNESKEGLYDSFESHYGKIYDAGDVYGDVILAGTRI